MLAIFKNNEIKEIPLASSEKLDLQKQCLKAQEELCCAYRRIIELQKENTKLLNMLEESIEVSQKSNLNLKEFFENAHRPSR